MLKLLDLFSGIGGFSLGLERSGAFKTVAFCEIEDFPRRVLAKHWPEVLIYDDVRTLSAERLRADGIEVDAICGGFPCQDISLAGKGAGLDGERSGLWREYARLIGELRPRYVIVENVSALLGRGLGVVLGDLAALGYDAEWHCIPASDVGAPHRRDRLWVVGYPQRHGRRQGRDDNQEHDRAVIGADGQYAGTLADAGRPRLPLSQQAGWGVSLEEARHQWGSASQCGWWSAEPDVGRVDNGVPRRVDRLKGLGNAVVPQVVELIGHTILQSERRVK